MKFEIVFTLVMFIAVSSAYGQGKADIAGVKWLTGCWQKENDKSGTLTLEQWTTSDGGTSFGIGRTFKSGKLVSWELMRIAQDNESAKFFAQLPNAEKATGFALKMATKDELIFENLQNDFPQRVIYRNAGHEKLAARIEGKNGEKEMAIDFPFKRVKCE
ncbi:MAG: hypothetical protein KA746_14405 [Pyrinomonadaceae bacterium]|nr:hypothetical protein [Pyrinomonadaceae bacterium]MBP6212546.1 hypothetical protein [Pyrinomonadaceae bacterium]